MILSYDSLTSSVPFSVGKVCEFVCANTGVINNGIKSSAIRNLTNSLF